jgi:outer membrane protein
VVSARSARQPEVNASFTYNGANSYRFASYEEAWEWHWSAGITATWDIWDGGNTRAVIDEKRLELEKANEDFEELRRSVRAEIRAAYLDMRHARDRVGANTDNVALAEKALAIARERHRSGLATYLEYTDANVALNRARLSYLAAVHDHMSAVARLEYVTGSIPPAVAARLEER